nr:melanoma inhibitory activity protein 3-like [Microcebus murinus]XP_012645650.1 melanoma inhibitory activity protein 3-like [Microcebus murinus]XP_012645652.1 melanoma inhibitory activity protein 3-like [Microcebus murinus]
MEVKRLFLILLLSAPCYPSRNSVNIFEYFPKNFTHPIHECFKEDQGFSPILVHILPDYVHLGPNFFGIPWKIIIIAAYLGAITLAIFFWSILFPIYHPQYQVNLQQISEKIKNFTKENAELVAKISICEQKINESKQCLQDKKRENEILLDTPHKFKTGNVKDKWEESKLRASRSNNYHLEGIKKNLDNSYEELEYRKAKKEAKFRMLKIKVDNLYEIYGQRKTAAEEKVRMKKLQQAQRERQLSQLEENVKLAAEEIETFKKQIESMKEQQQEAELNYKYQIATSEMAAQYYWLKTQAFRRERAEQAREAARLRNRLEIIQSQKQQEAYGMETAARRSPDTQSPPCTADSGPQSVPRPTSSGIPATNTQKQKVEVDARGPPGVPGPAHMPKPMAGPSSAFRDHGPLPRPSCPLRLSPHLKGHHLVW